MALTRINNQALTNVTSAGLPSGTVLQVVQAHFPGTDDSSTSILSPSLGSSQDFLTKSITTIEANSKIYVKTYSMHYISSGSAVNADGKLLRGSTEIDFCKYQIYQNDGVFIPFGFEMLDSPNVAAGTALTYKHQLKASAGTYSAGYGDSGGKVNSNIILMEIAG